MSARPVNSVIQLDVTSRAADELARADEGVLMICFEISVNGNSLCTAGVGEYGVLTAILSWVGSQSEEAGPAAKEERKQKADLHVGGLINEEHVSWLGSPFLIGVGDVVGLRVIRSETVDEPSSRQKRDDPGMARSNRYFLYQQYKREFEGIGGGNEPAESWVQPN